MSHSVLFCGTPEFAVPALKALMDDDAFHVQAVITQPDKPVGRKQTITPPPVKVVAEENGIEVHQPTSKADILKLKDLVASVDYLVVVAYGMILPQEILDAPTIAPLNIHASLLPRWRGASPIQHAILSGDTESGVTIQRMVKELDAGPIISQKTLTLEERETAPTLHDKLSLLGAELLVETLNEPLTETPQNEADVTHCSKLSREDGVVDPQAMTASEIDRHVRALVPWPGVTCDIDGETVKIIESSLEQTNTSIPLPCKDDSILYVVQLQQPGKTVMNAKDWKQGRQ